MGLPHPESFMITSPNKYLWRMQVPTVHKNIIKELLIQTLGLCCRNVAMNDHMTENMIQTMNCVLNCITVWDAL